MQDETTYIEAKNYYKGEIIFREGEKGGCMYSLESGRVGIYANYGTPKQTLLTELEEGSFFGEMGMLRGFPRSATAIALVPGTEVCVITWQILGTLFKKYPSKVIGIMQQMGQRIDRLSLDYIDACGAVTTLVKQRNALVKENKALHETLDRMQNEHAADGMPLWRRIAGEDSKEEDARFKRYMEEYRRYTGKR